MFICRVTMMVALCASALVGASTGSAATYLHDTTTTGNVLPAGAVIHGTLKSGTTASIASGVNSGITCPEATYAARVDASGGATVSGSLTSLTLGNQSVPNCTGSSGIDHCALQGGTVAAISASSSNLSGGTLTLGSSTSPLKIDCFAGTTYVCTYSSTGAVGVLTNATNELAYTNAPLSTSFLCSINNALSVTFAPNQVASTGGPLVLNVQP